MAWLDRPTHRNDWITHMQMDNTEYALIPGRCSYCDLGAYPGDAYGMRIGSRPVRWSSSTASSPLFQDKTEVYRASGATLGTCMCQCYIHLGHHICWRQSFTETHHVNSEAMLFIVR